ncbi:amidohydrolase [Spirochaetota bacterium]|nr:amidohydrolase [Spirochaetota bacterium]
MKLPPINLTLKDLNTCNYDRFILKSTIHMQEGEFVANVAQSQSSTNKTHSLKGYTAYPGLFNAHDHLLGTYYPRVGNGPYICWKPWDNDLKASKIYEERNRLPIEQIYLLSYYRHILSGVTTVCDHIPHLINDKQIESAYIRIVEQYCIAHEMSSYELIWGEDHEIEIQKAKRYNIPFVTHLEEGFDEESMRGVEVLIEKQGLSSNAVLVHCIACSEQDISLIAEKKASMVWCPNSNLFMFDKTANIKSFLEKNVNVSLGTDSPMSGSLHLLDEMKIASSVYKDFYNEAIPAQLIFKMVTQNPATAFKLNRLIGKIEPGKQADLILLKSKKGSPYERLIKAGIDEIEVVIRSGVPLYFHEKHKHLFYPDSLLKTHYERVRVIHKNTSNIAYLIGKPLKLKKRIQKSARFNKEIDFFPIEAP